MEAEETRAQIFILQILVFFNRNGNFIYWSFRVLRHNNLSINPDFFNRNTYLQFILKKTNNGNPYNNINQQEAIKNVGVP